MNTRPIGPHAVTCRAAAWAVCLVVAAISAAPAVAADRVVLIEEFTNEYCGSCQYAGPPLDWLVDVYPDSFAFIQYQMFDVDYSTPFGDGRWAFYEAEYTPAAVFDGHDMLEGAVSNCVQQYNIYRANHFLPRRAMETDVTIDISAVYFGGPVHVVTATVGIEPDGEGKDLRIYIAQVLDHWPSFKPYHRNGFKQVGEAHDISLEPGGSQAVEDYVILDDDSLADPNNVKIIAWVQAPPGRGVAEVYQAAIRLWPLEAGPDDYDGDGVLDAEDNCPYRANPGQLDGDEDGVGDCCDNCDQTWNPDQDDTDEDSFGDACDNCPVLHNLDPNDTDEDTVGNACDSCPEVPAPAGVDPFGRSLGCIDLDCDVDGDDFALFETCMGGPGQTTTTPGCDVDGDDDADLADFAVISANFTGPLVSPAIYVGAMMCVDCHTDQHQPWAQTVHYTAFDTLISSGDDNNVLCFPCHTVGYGEPSGFVDLETTPQLAGIQCENCHGPGSNHTADPNIPLALHMEAESCGACHQSCHGLCGDDHHPQFEQWSISTHSTALDTVKFDPNGVDSCLQCHSTDYRLAPPDAKPTLAEAEFSIECVACHSPHGTANGGQLRLPPHELCADCHTMQGAVPGEDPLQAQSETLHGTGGHELDGTPMDGPHTEHWWGIPKECVQCHVHKEPYGGPQQPVNSGHTFEANMRACTPCHTEEVATMLVEMARYEIEARLDAIAPYYDPVDPLYVDPNDLQPEELAQYIVATFDYRMVYADRSYGSHNPAYARALLSEAELFFDIPPWLWRLHWLDVIGPAERPPAAHTPAEVRP